MRGAPFETMRVFLALNMDVANTRKVVDLGRALRTSVAAPRSARWVAPTKLHVTLKYFGAIDVGLASPLIDAMKPLAESEPEPRVRFGRITGFPSPEAARALVLAIDDRDGQLARLFVEIERRTGALGFPREDRPYRPHVTLARTPAPADVRALSLHAFSLGDARGTELVLYRSDLTVAGAEYTPLLRSAFGGTRNAVKTPSVRAPMAPLPPEIERALPPEKGWK